MPRMGYRLALTPRMQVFGMSTDSAASIVRARCTGGLIVYARGGGKRSECGVPQGTSRQPWPMTKNLDLCAYMPAATSKRSGFIAWAHAAPNPKR